MLKRENRLNTPTFKEVLTKGRNTHTPSFSLKYILSPNRVTFSVAVPKSVEKSAVKRNTIRRRIRAFLEEYAAQHPKAGISAILFAKKSSKTLQAEEMKKEIKGMLQQF